MPADFSVQCWSKFEGGTRQDWCPDLAQGQGYELVAGWRLALKSKGEGVGLDFGTLSVFFLWILYVLALIVDCGLSCFSQYNQSHWTEGQPLKEQRSSCAPQVAMGRPGGWPGEASPAHQLGALCRYVYANPARYTPTGNRFQWHDLLYIMGYELWYVVREWSSIKSCSCIELSSLFGPKLPHLATRIKRG